MISNKKNANNRFLVNKKQNQYYGKKDFQKF